ncbi:MAG: hypothetical protein K2V38_02790 [Gemmataceae bacterium]|nr:hypothetical protein [Gemmataceae bacterium]
MRATLFALAALFAAGCGSDKPVVVTPEMEAKQKAADQQTQSDERDHQKRSQENKETKP